MFKNESRPPGRRPIDSMYRSERGREIIGEETGGPNPTCRLIARQEGINAGPPISISEFE